MNSKETSLEKQLIIKTSLLPGAGKGLFTRRAIEKGGLVVEYKGIITSWKKIQENKVFNAYVFYINRSNVIDARHDKKAMGRYANDAKGLGRQTGIKNNAEYIVRNKKVYIHASRSIAAGEEIMVGYGKEYWDVMKYNQRLEKLEVAKRLKKAGVAA